MNKIHIKNLRIGVEECRNMTPNKCRCHTHTLTAICETVTKWIYWLVFMIFLLVCATIATQSERCLRYTKLCLLVHSFGKKDLCAYLVFWKNRVHSRRQKVLAVARVTHYSLMFESHRGPVVFMFFLLCTENQTIKWFSFIIWLWLRFMLASKQIHLEEFYWNTGKREDYRADWVCREKHWHSTVALE